MNIEQHMKFWLDSAAHDPEAAESLFNASKFDWSLFLGHLVLEKALKAVYVRDNANEIPPRTHNLVKLAEATKLKIDEGTNWGTNWGTLHAFEVSGDIPLIKERSRYFQYPPER